MSTETETERNSLVIPPLPGIDQAEALRALGNNTRLFVRMLYDFRKNYSSLPAFLRERAAVGDWKEIRKRAHAIKGVAGYIGSQALMKRAHLLEDALSNGPTEEGQGCFSAFVNILERTLTNLSALPAAEDGDGATEATECARVVVVGAAKQLQGLSQQLRRGEAAAEECFATIQPDLEASGFGKHAREIASLIDDIEYERAAVLIDELLAGHEQGNGK